MKLLDLIFRGGKSPEDAKQHEEQKLVLQRLANRIEVGLGQPFNYVKFREAFYSKDDIIAITPPGRELFRVARMKKVEKKDLLFQKDTAGDAKNIYPRKHFEAVAEALDWNCEMYMREEGNAPVLFKTKDARVWIAPIIIKK
jgi:hypothetical protein